MPLPVKNILCLACFCFLSRLAAQDLPALHRPGQTPNYFEICAQLDAYFATEYQADQAECWDDESVKYQRWKWLWRDRVHADGTFPDLRAQWLQYQKHVPGAGQDRNNQPTWQHEGPTKNAGGGYWGMGRVKHVAFHPTDPGIFYVGTPDGGIWKTLDGGSTYTALGDQLPYLPVGVILLDYQHPDTLYISLADKGGWWQYGFGVYKSTDGGAHWSPTGLDWALADNKVIYNMVMSPSDPQTIIVACNQGLLRTTDGGTSWENVQAGEYTDLQYRPGDASTLYAAKHDYWGKSQLLKSTDGGTSWVQISDFQDTQNYIKLCVTPANPDWLGMRVSVGKKFLLSKDAGVSFAEQSVLPEDAHISFSAADTNVLYCGGLVVFRSDDQGASWTQVTHWYNDGVHVEVHADVHDIVQNPYNDQQIWFCNDGGIYRYDEPTQQWTDLSNGLGIAQFYSVAVGESGPFRIAAGSQDNGGWLRKPAPAATWTHTNGGDAMTQAMDPTNSAIMYTEYYGGNDIYRSMDAFASATNISDNIADNPDGDWVTPFTLNPRNPKSLVFAFHDIYRTHDRGNTFQKISENLTGSVDNKLRTVEIAPSDTNYIYATWRSRLFRTTDGGTNWKNFNVLGSTDDVTGLAIHPGHPQRLWVTKGGLTAGKKVFVSNNGGQSWGNLSANLPNVPTNCILFDSLTNYLFVGTDIGVFYSDAATIHWEPYGLGLPNVFVLDFALRQLNHRLYVATHGRGVYSVPLLEVVATQAPAAAAQTAVFPNPAHTTLFFSTLSKETVDGVARVYNLHGQAVVTQAIRHSTLDQVTLDIQQLAGGVYFLQVKNNASGELLVQQRVVVQH